ncbi:MAG: acyltransferase [Planctomycetes bacterium]|nr:acyltransferase [Planctomycetota bacterium]
MGALRMVLAWFVVAAHADLVGTGAVRYAGPFALYIFYAVSGYYMTLTLTSKYAGPGGIRAYFVNRALRILPMYAVLLAAFAPLVLANANPTRGAWAALGNPGRVAAAVLQLTPLGQESVHWMHIAGGSLHYTPEFRTEAMPAWHLLVLPTCWSLSIECGFYLLAPLLVRRPLMTRCVIAGASLAWWAAALAVRAPVDPWIYRALPASLVFFMAGSVVRALHERHQARFGALSAALRARPALAALAVGGFLALLVAWRLAAPHSAHPAMWLSLVPLYALSLTTLPVLFNLSGGRSPAARVDKWLADLAYPIFLVHYPIIRLTGWVDPLAILGASAAVSAVALVLVDVPVRSWKLAPPARATENPAS